MKKTTRTFKKFAAITSASLLVACMVAPAMNSFADGEVATGTIAVQTNQTNHIFNAYQIFDGDVSVADNTTTFANVTWGSGINSDQNEEIISELKALNIMDGSTNIFDGATNAADVAKALAKVDPNTLTGSDYVAANIDRIADVFAAHLSATSTALSANADIDSGTDGPQAGYISDSVDAGYYLVIDGKDTGALATGDALSKYLLDVVDGNVIITPKYSAPTVEKKVKEDDKKVTGKPINDSSTTEKWNDVADYCIGEAVPFKLYGTMPFNLDDYSAYYYKFTDTLATQFDLPETITVKVEGTTIVFTAVKSNENSVSTIKGYSTTATDNNCRVTLADGKIIIDFENIKAYTGVTKTTVVTVEYDAVLNSSAGIGLNGQTNAVDLTYSNNPNSSYNPNAGDETEQKDIETGKTPEDKVIVFTYELDVTKYLEEVAEGNKAGANKAGFKLYRKEDDTSYYAKLDGNNKITEWTTAEDQGTEIKTAEGGLVKFIGLDDGQYFLKETTTPVGYNTMADLEVNITAKTANNQAWNMTANNEALKGLSVDNGVSADAETGVAEINIVNLKGSGLPSTGGIGTTIFYLGGGAMAAIGGVYLISKKRMKNNQE